MRRSRSWCWYRYISNMFVLNDLTLFPWWAILIIELKLDMFIPFAFAYYAITWPPLNGNLPSIFMWYFCCFFQLTVWPSRGFNHFFQKFLCIKFLRWKVSMFFLHFTFQIFSLKFRLYWICFDSSLDKKMFFFSLVIMFLKWICWWQKMSYIIILNRRNYFFICFSCTTHFSFLFVIWGWFFN